MTQLEYERSVEARGEARGVLMGKAEVARNLVNTSDLSDEVIARYTGLSLAEIAAIRGRKDSKTSK